MARRFLAALSYLASEEIDIRRVSGSMSEGEGEATAMYVGVPLQCREFSSFDVS